MVIEILQKRGILPNSIEIGDSRVTELFVSQEKLADMRMEIETLESIQVNEIDVQWIQILAEGWAHPLKGFMRENQYLQVRSKQFLKIKFQSIYLKKKKNKNK